MTSSRLATISNTRSPSSNWPSSEPRVPRHFEAPSLGSLLQLAASSLEPRASSIREPLASKRHRRPSITQASRCVLISSPGQSARIRFKAKGSSACSTQAAAVWPQASQIQASPKRVESSRVLGSTKVLGPVTCVSISAGFCVLIRFIAKLDNATKSAN